MSAGIGQYEIPWRPVNEIGMTIAWATGSVASTVVATHSNLPTQPAWTIAAICLGMAVARGIQAAPRWIKKRNLLNSKGLVFISPADAIKEAENASDALWLGYGFEWTAREAQMLWEIQRRKLDVDIMERHIKSDPEVGAEWIQGIGLEAPLHLPLKLLEGHTLLTGTTGAGKTRLFETWIMQAVLAGDSVFVLDPKGDKDLRDTVRRSCELAGTPERFIMFHPADTANSVRIDPLKNWNRSTELASRLAALIPSETGSDPFTAFGWKSMNDVVQGMLEIDERPNLTRMRRYVEGGVEKLLGAALRAYFTRKDIKDWRDRLGAYKRKSSTSETEACVNFYQAEIEEKDRSGELDGLISGYTHNREHFQKMVASLIPILSMLTTGELGELLSPSTNLDDPRPSTDTSRIINMSQAAYIGLDSLSDKTVASAIGSILLSDLTAVAGDRYNYGDAEKKIWVFIDEAAEVLNEPTIQLLNKGRGAGFQIVLATQTISDLIVRMGSEDAAYQVLGNTNNKITLRLKDEKTEDYFADGLPTVQATSVEHVYQSNVDGNVSSAGGRYGETLKAEEIPLFPPRLLKSLPPLHYMAQLTNGRVLKGRIPILTHNEKE